MPSIDDAFNTLMTTWERCLAEGMASADAFNRAWGVCVYEGEQKAEQKHVTAWTSNIDGKTYKGIALTDQNIADQYDDPNAGMSDIEKEAYQPKILYNGHNIDAIYQEIYDNRKYFISHKITPDEILAIYKVAAGSGDYDNLLIILEHNIYKADQSKGMAYNTHAMS